MNNEKTREDKLREAAEKVLISNHRKYDDLNRSDSLTRRTIDSMVEFLKSKEAAEYHKSLQPPVDLESLTTTVFLMIPNGIKTHAHAMDVAKSIIDTIKPHLQPAAPESDAVDFADYILDNCSFTDSDEGPRQWFLYGPDGPITSKELHEKYKQSKTNSDATNNS